MVGEILTGVAAVMVAWNGRKLAQVKKEVKGPNGMPTGQMVAEIKASQALLQATLANHVADADVHMKVSQ